MDKSFYIKLIKDGKKYDNGNIKIVIPCSPLAIKSHNISLDDFIKNSNYKLIRSNYVDEFKKIIAFVKEEKFKITNKGYKNLLFELVKLDNEFNLIVSKIENKKDTIVIIGLEREIDLIFDRQKEIYSIVNNSTPLE